MPVRLPAWSALIVRASRSSTDEFLMKENLVNKNIVHMIDDIFWHMPFKNPTHAEKVIMFIIQIIHIITIIRIYILYVLYVLYQLYVLYLLYVLC